MRGVLALAITTGKAVEKIRPPGIQPMVHEDVVRKTFRGRAETDCIIVSQNKL